MRKIIALAAAALLFASPAIATDLSITAANVSLVSGPEAGDQVAGEAFPAGSVVYYKSATGSWFKALANGTAEQAGAEGLGVALATADAAGARVSVARPGAVVAVGTGTAAVAYVPSAATAGHLAPIADMASTNIVSLAALGIGSNQLLLCSVANAGSVHP